MCQIVNYIPPPPHTHTECQNGKITLGERKRIVGREWIMKSATS